MSRIPFFKMVGGGNDFIVIDNRESIFAGDVTDAVRRLCSRCFSIGADGLVVIENTTMADFNATFYNNNGVRSRFCGNGARCAARFAYMNVIASKRMRMDTDSGIIKAEVLDRDVKLELAGTDVIESDVSLPMDGRKITGHYVLIGVPHFIVFVKNLWDGDIGHISRKIRFHDHFGNDGTNVDFVEVRDSGYMAIRSYERGVEKETLACGSGCIAASLAAAALEKLASPVTCGTLGGSEFIVEFSSGLRKVSLTGEARLVYKGEYWKEALEGFSLETKDDKK